MKEMMSSVIHEGKAVSLWKDLGVYTMEFYPLVSIKIPGYQIKDIVKDLEIIVKKMKVSHR